MTSLRPMRWWDIEPALEIERQLFPDAWSEETFWAELAGVPDTRFYVVGERDGRVVGYAGLFLGGDQADVQTIAAAPAVQGEGVGTSLLRALLSEAERRGARDVLLEVRADNGAAQRLYEKFEFKQINVRRGYYDRGAVDGHVLRRRQTGAAKSLRATEL